MGPSVVPVPNTAVKQPAKKSERFVRSLTRSWSLVIATNPNL